MEVLENELVLNQESSNMCLDNMPEEREGLPLPEILLYLGEIIGTEM